jgi:pimeloyl-ACP methyl ester carboxylesterase
VHDLEDGDGLLVLLHAAGAGPRALRELSDNFRTVIGRTLTPRLPQTVVRVEQTPLSRQIELAREALASATGDERRVLFGHSFGGLVALLTMLDTAEVDAEVDAAILYEPIVMACLDPQDPRDAAARATDRELIDYLAERTQAQAPELGVARFVETYNEVSWDSLPEGPRRALVHDAPNMVELTQCVHHHRIDLNKIRALSVPILVLQGDRSPVVLQLMAQRLSALLPDSTLITIEGVGHMGPHLAPTRVFSAAAPFLRALASTSPEA